MTLYVTSFNNLLLNLYFDNSTVESHVIYALNMHANFHVVIHTHTHTHTQLRSQLFS